MTEEKRPKPVVLVILDGWGVAPPSRGNAIAQAKTPNFNKLIRTYPATVLAAAGEAVGLSFSEASNSEIGHLSLGSGRLVYQDLPRVNRAIADGSFFNNETLVEAVKSAKKNKKSLHLAGLLSTSSSQSSWDHLLALLEICRRQKFPNVFLHLFLDGRDMPYNSGLALLARLADELKKIKIGSIASLSGRSYALDRDNNWDKTAAVYQAMSGGQSAYLATDPVRALAVAYEKKIYDEQLAPAVVVGKNNQPLAKIEAGDSLIFFNIKADAIRQLFSVFADPDFDNFSVSQKKIFLVSLVDYGVGQAKTAFPAVKINQPLAKVIAGVGLRQLHLAETEKYSQVTFFFNGEKEEPFSGEDRLLISSAKSLASEDKSSVTAKQLAKKVTEAIICDQYDFIVVNFANAEVAAHSGNFAATVKACQNIDGYLKLISEAVLAADGLMIITADHGNAEEMLNLQSGQEHRDHSLSPVPFILVGNAWEGKTIGRLSDSPSSDLSLLEPTGKLSDVAPTILKLMKLKIPSEMNGRSLV